MTPRFLARLGLAITNPRWALAVAADRRHAGRSGTDLMLVIALVLAATQLRGLIAAIWLGTAVELGLGVRAATQVLTRALTVELGFLVVAALVLWLAAGPRRNLGRAFDLACVAALPLLLVDLGATVLVRALALELPGIVGVALAGLSYAWAGVLVALSLRPARIATSVAPPLPPALTRPARLASWAVIAVAVTGLVVQVVWIARSMDSLRPMTTGERAPGFALASVGAGGELGPRLALESSRGKLTVIEFWATWCKPCLAALPRLDALARKHPDVVVLAINLDDPAAARALWDERRYALTLLADDGEVSARYGVTTIPHSVVIDPAGVVRRVARGGTAGVEAEIERILAEGIRN